MHKKRLLPLLLAIISLVMIIGGSYAVWNYNFIGNSNTISTADMSIEFLESNSNIITIENALPMGDNDGKSQETTFNFSVTSRTPKDAVFGYILSIEKLEVDNDATALNDNDIKVYLRIQGVLEEDYNLIDVSNYTNYNTFNSIEFIETLHTSKLHCYGIKFNTNEGIIYYSGDTRNLDNIINIIHSNDNIDKIYVDTSSEYVEDSVHVYIEDLKEEIPVNLRDRIYCMHINDNKCIDLIEEYGFNIVRLI